MRIVSWNVNGIRAAHRKGFARWLGRCGADIIAVQEIRAAVEQIPDRLREPKGWRAHFTPAVRPGYSGVGLFSREAPNELQPGMGIRAFDDEGRVQIARFGRLRIVNAYFPNGNGVNRDLSRIPFKLRFYQRLFERLKPAMEAGEPILVMGDFNTAHEEIDLARPRDNRENSGFRPEERRAFSRWITAGWTDTFRHFRKEGGHYTWWSQRFGVREKNIGWRLDYVLASPGALPYVKNAAIHPEVHGSDHCPVSVEIDERVL
ncbi:MAG: exodeoxyribonuclease III [Myxococcaceae bacterium]|nr:exodeoxyribonuclease III [Myxococcaceae bacterium]